MECVLTGMRQCDNVGRYYFDAVGSQRNATKVTADADLNLIRKYKIALQELPLLCQRLLEARAKIETVTFLEGDMVRYVEERTAAADALIEKRKARRPRAVPGRAGQAWRGSPAPQR